MLNAKNKIYIKHISQSSSRTFFDNHQMGIFYGGFVIGIISEKEVADGTKIINKFLGFITKIILSSLCCTRQFGKALNFFHLKFFLVSKHEGVILFY